MKKENGFEGAKAIKTGVLKILLMEIIVNYNNIKKSSSVFMGSLLHLELEIESLQ